MIFATANTEKIDIVCSERNEHCELNGSGLFKNEENCIMNTATKIVYGNSEIGKDQEIAVQSRISILQQSRQ